MDMPTPASTETKGVFVADRRRAGASGRTIPVVARGIRAGQVYANAFGAGGGMKNSGRGREKGFAALRTTIVKHG